MEAQRFILKTESVEQNAEHEERTMAVYMGSRGPSLHPLVSQGFRPALLLWPPPALKFNGQHLDPHQEVKSLEILAAYGKMG